MKKILALILAALMILCFVACAEDPEADKENADDETSQTGNAMEVDVFEKTDDDDDDKPRKVGVAVYDLNEDGHYEITSYKPDSVEVVDIVLPSKAPDGREIVAIGAEAFKPQNSVKSIEIPASYKKIGNHAFFACSALTSVSMTNSVVEIGVGAFSQCTNLESFTGTDAVTTIAADAFSDCVSLKAIDLSGAVQTINTFRGCTALKTVTISNDITFIEKYAFNDCTSLKYEIENGAKYLGNNENKFVALISIDNLYTDACIINDNTKLVAKNAFSNCPALETVTVGENTRIIDADCFVNTPRFTYNVYADVSYLGTKDNPYAIAMHANVPAATGVQLHKDVKMISGDAFAKCVNLTDIDFSANGAEAALTEKEWNNIYKVDGWNRDLILKIHCSDGIIELS